MGYNKAQQEAIDASASTNVIISAGAGSGKTEILSEKVLKLVLEDNIDPSALLVLTFTNKAAFEMKERIIEKFQKKGDDPKRAEEIQSAHIQTFDSFSLYLVKKYSYRLGLPDSVFLVDEDILYVKRASLLDEILAEHYAQNDEGLIETLGKFNLKDDSKTKKVILNLDQKLRQLLPSQKRDYIDNYETKFLSDSFLEEQYNLYIDEYKKQITQGVRKAIFLYQHAGEKLSLLLEHLNEKDSLPSIEGQSFANEHVEDMYEKVMHLLTLDGDEFITEFKDLCDSDDFNGQKTKKYWNKETDTEEKACFERMRDSVRNLKDKLYGKEDFPTQKSILRSLLPDEKRLFSLIDELDKRMLDYQKVTGAFSFSDIAVYALSLLEEERFADIREEIQNRFKFILVDEYQDTNDFQEEFLNKLSAKSTLFVVGDAKQSIYGFRNADCQLFLDRKKRYYQDNIPEKEKVIEMNTNYRSVKRLLMDVNTIFINFMNEKHGGINYRLDSEQLHYDDGVDLYDEKALYPKGEYGIHLLDYEEKDEFSEADESAMREEALIIIKDIQDKIDSHYQIYCGKGKGTRDCTYKDFAILLRVKRNFSFYQQLFHAYGIPLNNELESHLKDIDAVNVLESLLRLVSHYQGKSKENIKHLFLSVARSYLYGKEAGYDDEHLYQLLSREDALKKIESDPIMEKVKKFSQDNYSQPLSALFLRLLDEFNVIEKLYEIGAVEDNISKIESLYSLVLQQESMGEGISDFVSLFRNISKYSIELSANTVSQVEDAVELVTIHKSKGLQYPIVYMPCSQNKMSENNIPDADYTFTKSLGILLPNYSLNEEINTFLKDRYKETEGAKDGEVSEFVRLLYVACTRPKETLYIVGHEKKKGESLYNMLRYTYQRRCLNLSFLEREVKEGNLPAEKVQEYETLLKQYRENYTGLKRDEEEDEDDLKQDIFDTAVKEPEEEELDAKEKEISLLLYKYFITKVPSFSEEEMFSLLKQSLPSLSPSMNHAEVEKVLDRNDETLAELLKALREALTQEEGDFTSFFTVNLTSAERKNEKKKKEKIEEAKMEFFLIPLYKVLYPQENPLVFVEQAFPTRFFPSNRPPLKPAIKYNPETLFEKLTVNEEDIAYTKKEKKRASKLLPDEDLVPTGKISRGLYLHSLMENTDFYTKDTSFIPDERDKALIDRVLKQNIFQFDKEDKVYKEYGYYDSELQSNGYIDCLIVKKDEILILDYKLKKTEDEAYKRQLGIYKKNVQKLYLGKPVKTYLISLVNATSEEVDTD